MYILIGVMLFILIAIAIANQYSKAPQVKTDHTPLPYQRLDYVMSRAERAFYDVLLGLLRHPTDPHAPPQMLVFPQIPLLRLVRVQPGTDARQKWVNKIDRKRVDFVLVEVTSNRTRLAIELDDSSHEREDRQGRDVFVEAALRAAGVPLLRLSVQPQSRYDRSAVAQQIKNALAGTAQN